MKHETKPTIAARMVENSERPFYDDTVFNDLEHEQRKLYVAPKKQSHVPAHFDHLLGELNAANEQGHPTKNIIKQINSVTQKQQHNG